MILPYDIKPQSSLYVYGAYILKEFANESTLRITDLYLEVSSKHDVSFSVFVLALDWLFMINALDLKFKDGDKYVYQKTRD